jgi:hypothetical protein
MLVSNIDFIFVSEWLLLNAYEQFFSYFMVRTIYSQWNMMMMSALFWTNMLDFYSASSLKQQSTGIDVATLFQLYHVKTS